VIKHFQFSSLTSDYNSFQFLIRVRSLTTNYASAVRGIIHRVTAVKMILCGVGLHVFGTHWIWTLFFQKPMRQMPAICQMIIMNGAWAETSFTKHV